MNNTNSSPTTSQPREPVNPNDSSHRASLLSLYTHALTLWQTEHSYSTAAYSLLQQTYSIPTPPPHLPYPTPDPKISSLSDEELEVKVIKIFDIIENWRCGLQALNARIAEAPGGIPIGWPVGLDAQAWRNTSREEARNWTGRMIEDIRRRRLTREEMMGRRVAAWFGEVMKKDESGKAGGKIVRAPRGLAGEGDEEGQRVDGYLAATVLERLSRRAWEEGVGWRECEGVVKEVERREKHGLGEAFD